MRSFKARTLVLTLFLITVTSCILMILSILGVHRENKIELRRQVDNSVLLIKTLLNNTESNHIFFKKYTEQIAKKQIKTVVDEALVVIDTIYTQVQSGTITKKKGERLALDALSEVRFGKEGYLFVFDNDYTMLVNSNENLIGQNFENFTDKNGAFVFQSLKNSAQSSSSEFVSYWWPLINSSEDVEKLGYVREFSPWNWYIGSGYYDEEIQEELKIQTQQMLHELKEDFKEVSVLGSGSFALFSETGEILYIKPELKKGFSLDTVEKIIHHAKNSNDPINYTITLDRKIRTLESYARYFPPQKWILLSIIDTKEFIRPTISLFKQQLILLIIFLLISSLIVVIVVNRLSTPLHSLTVWAQKFAKNSFSPEKLDSQLLKKLSKNQILEVEHLAKAFDVLWQTLQHYIRHLVLTTQVKEAYESQLRIAVMIQESMLPQKFPPYPELDNIDLCAYIKPAKMVSGDFYDFFVLSDRFLCFTIGDVTDKGIPAALFMVRSKALLQNTATLLHSLSPSSAPSPGQVLSYVNTELCKENELVMFVTVLFGVFDTQTGELLLSNAGHIPPFLISDTSITSVKIEPERALGVRPGIIYKETSIPLKPNTSLLLYTDGLTDARNKKGEEYGQIRVDETIHPLKKAKAHHVLLNTLYPLSNFVLDTPPFDDITLLSLSYCPNKSHLLAKIKSKKDKVPHVHKNIERFALRHNLNEATTSIIKSVTEEVLNNIISHSSQDEKEDIFILFDINTPYIILEFTDSSSKQFNPIEHLKKSEKNLSKEKKAYGGMGLMIISSQVDEASYERKGQFNILQLKIKIGY
jgi:sigma-B regulation protein RsbU (phosphoserine phosphatase)